MDFFPERFNKTAAPKGDLSPAGDLLMAVWRDYLAHFRAYAPLAALPLLAFPFMALGTALTVVGVKPDATILTSEPENFPLYLTLMIAGVAIIVITNVLAHAGLNVTVMAESSGKHVSFADAIKVGRRLFWPFAGTIVLLYVAISIGFALLFLPGILIGTFLIFAEPVAAIEELGPVASLKRSARLVTGRFWSVLWRIAVGYVVIAIGSLALSFPLVQYPTAVFGHVFGDNLIGLRIAVSCTLLVSSAITALVLPLFVSLQVHLYDQLKRRA